MLGLFEMNRKHFLTTVLIAVLSVCAYSNSLNSDFVIDDHGLLFTDPLFNQWNTLVYHFVPEVHKVVDMGLEGRPYYRPFAHVIPGMCVLLFGNNPAGYHIFNLILFIAACLMLYYFIFVLTKRWEIAFLTSVLFCTHPINGLMINYITASIYSFQLIVLLMSCLFFYKSLQTKPQWLHLLLSLFFFGLSLLCHETSMALPAYFVLIVLWVKPNNLKPALYQCVPSFIMLGAYFIFRMFLASLKNSVLDKISFFDMNVFEYTASFAKLTAQYLFNLFSLEQIVLTWATPVVRNNLLLWNIGFLGVVIVMFWVIRRRWGMNQKAIAMLWFMLGFPLVGLACLYQPIIGILLEPHWLYFANIGMFLLIALILVDLKMHLKKIGIAIIVLLVSANVISSRYYNYLWADEARYCQYWLGVVPDFKSVMFHLARAYSKRGELLLSKQYYKQSLDGEFRDWQVFTNLGLIADEQDDQLLAVEYYRKAMEIHPRSWVTLNNLGALYFKLERIEEGENILRQALEINRFSLEPRLILAKHYLDQNDPEQAKLLYMQNLKINPYDKGSTLGYMKTLIDTRELGQAMIFAQKTLLHHSDAELLLSMAGMCALNNNISLASDFSEKALRVNSKNKFVYLELGKFLGNMNRFDDAIKFWEQGKRLYPDEKQFEDLINQAKALQAR